MKNDQYYIPDYAELVPIDDSEIQIKLPLQKKTITGDAVPLVTKIWDNIDGEEHNTLESLNNNVDTPKEDIKELLSILVEVNAIKKTGEKEDFFEWSSSNPEKTRENIRESKIALISDSNFQPQTTGRELEWRQFNGLSKFKSTKEDYDLLITIKNGVNPAFHKEVLEHIWKRDIGWLPIRLSNDKIRLGPLSKRGRGACYNCFYTRFFASKVEPRSAVKETKKRENNKKQPEYLKIIENLTTSLGLIESLKYISKLRKPITDESVIEIDIFSLDKTKSDVIKLPDCEICGKN